MSMRECILPQSLHKYANQAGLYIAPDSQGQYRVKSRITGKALGTFTEESAARKFIGDLINQNVPDLDELSPIPFLGEMAGVNPPRIGDQPRFFSALRTGWMTASTGPASIITPFRDLFRNIELLSGIKTATGVYEPTQLAKNAANQAYAFTKRAFNIAGKQVSKTYNEVLENLNSRAYKFTPRERQLSVLYGEAFTKQELAQPGMLTPNGLDAFDLQAAEILSGLGQAEEIPNLMRTNALIDDFLENRADFANIDLKALQVAVLEQRIPPEIFARAERLVANAGDEDTVFKVIQKLGMTGEEQNALVLLRHYMDLEVPPELSSLVAGVNKPQGKLYNIPVIYRYASAPDLESGMKSGRAQFARKMKMSPELVQMAEDRLSIMRPEYERAGKSLDAMAGAQYPIFRQFMDVGIYPFDQHGASAKGNINSYVRMLKESLPEASELYTQRVLSGHLNPYELDPAVTANKHIRNLIHREMLDPSVRAGKEIAKAVRHFDSRSADFLIDYLNNLEGIPDPGFKKLNDVIRTSMRMIGMKADDQLAERTVFTLTKLASQASIPFRPALVVRNFFSNTVTASIVGAESYTHGLATVLGKGKTGYRNGNHRQVVEELIRKGVIDPNSIPLHAHSELFGFDVKTLAGPNAGPMLGQLSDLVDKAFDAGFSLYRSGDDWGRAVAFYSGKHRVNKHLSEYVMSKAKTPESYEAMKAAAKIKTFHEIVEREFDSLVGQGLYEEAEDYIGKELANKVHQLYGNANHPAGWGGPVGRLFGQFGTFPTQYLQMMMEGVTRGTTKDKVEFLTTQSLINMGIVYAGAEVLDADLQSWSTFGSLQYAGGPYADIFINLASAWSGNDAQKSLALRSLRMLLPSLDNPASPFVPGSYVASDIRRSIQQDAPFQGFLRAIGIRPLVGGESFEDLTRWDEGLEWIQEIGPG